jgi:hypothetical protein
VLWTSALKLPSSPKLVATAVGSGVPFAMCLNVSPFFSKSTEYGRRRVPK